MLLAIEQQYSGLVVFDDAGRPRVSLGATPAGLPMVTLYDERQTARIEVHLSAKGEPTLGFSQVETVQAKEQSARRDP